MVLTESLFSNKIAMVAAVLALVAAAWAGQTAVVVLLGLALCVAGLSGAWSSLSLRKVSCERRLTAHRAFPGDHLDLTLRLVNRKLLPLPWIRVRDEVPAVLMPAEAGLTASIERSSSMLWYSAVSWKSSLVCRSRGYYPLGPLTVTTGDIFGLHPRTSVQAADEAVIVYPRLLNLQELGLPSLAHLGDAAAPRRLFEDPSRTMGVRAYSPGDSLRRVHWKASARQQRLQVRVFESTTDLKVALFLPIESFDAPMDTRSAEAERLELGISTIASLAAYLVERDYQAGLWVNSSLADSGRPVRILPGAGVEQLMLMLEGLAKVTASSCLPFGSFLEAERVHLPFGSTLMFVVGHVASELAAAFADLRAAGYRVVVFPAGEGGR